MLPSNLSSRLGHRAATPLEPVTSVPGHCCPSPAHGCAGTGDTFGFTLRWRGLLSLARKRCRPGTAGDQRRGDFWWKVADNPSAAEIPPANSTACSPLTACPGGN